MTALAQNRSTIKLPPEGVVPDLSYVPIAASTKIYQGAMVGLSATGLLVPATSVPVGGIVIGKSEEFKDNSAGAASALSATVRHGAFKWNNSAAADAIAQANLFQDCYAVDDQTVALTDGNSTRPRAGKIFQVDSDGVWVVQGPIVRDIGNGVGAGAAAGSVISLPITLASIAGNGALFSLIPGFACRVTKISMTFTVAGTGAGATITLTPSINAVNLTGGVITPTLGNSTLWATINATAITGANTLTPSGATGTLTITASATTVFTAGIGVLTITLA
jgi:hypothetical protein